MIERVIIFIMLEVVKVSFFRFLVFIELEIELGWVCVYFGIGLRIYKL